MPSFRVFLGLFRKKGLNASESGRLFQNLLYAHAAAHASRRPCDLKCSSEAFSSFSRVYSDPCRTVHYRYLHMNGTLLQMSQQETDETLSNGNGNGNGNGNDDRAAAAIVDEKAKISNDVAAKGALSPIVPGMPSVRRGVQVAPIGVTLSVHGLIKEMTERIKKRLFQEAIDIYREWLQCIDPITSQPNKPLVTPCNIALLAEGLKGAPMDILMKRVEEMRRLGLSPNTDTFYVLFNAAADSKDFVAFDRLFSLVQERGVRIQAEWCIKAITALRGDTDVWKVMDYVRIMVANDLAPDDAVISKLVSCFSRIGQAMKATDLVRWAQKRDAFPSMTALGDLLQASVETDTSEGALVALDLLFGRRKARLVKGITLDEGTLLAVLSMAARTGDLQLSTKAWDVLQFSLKQVNPPSDGCYLARLHAAVTGGDLDLAIATLQAMEKDYASQASSDIFCPFTSLKPFVLGCARGGSSTLDAAYFKLEAISATQAPLSAINCVILGCSNVWDIDRAYQTFEAIRSVFGHMPNIHSCNALIDGFAKMKKVAETLKVYEFIIDSRLQPNKRTYGILIKAHIVNRDTKSAMEMINQMSDSGFSVSKEIALKLRRRFIRECDEEGARQILDFKRKFNYSDGFSGDARRSLLFPFTADFTRRI